MSQDTDRDNLNIGGPEKAKLPQGLNVLTILTFVGCGLLGLITMCMPLLCDFFLKVINDELTSGKDLTAKRIADLEKGKAGMELMQQHAIPLLAVGMIGIILCFVGALWMRKLKKDGFWLYVAGELMPLIAVVFILGVDYYKSIGNLIGALLAIVFVVLYSFQRKYLTQ